ncbi:Uncharacterised protein [Mycobacteroides abscessus subsp. abscessus]|nr:hypothetical protein MA6G0125S_4098 [Mycobacteroides abscessus 6G-0125-S]EIU39299.1 hypothetical protein MA6G0125R_3057 [Mycobacteroides abscessus 6G-0125-R]EIU53560.1 hypothetical protein MA6G0728S_3784 [Mycobacteroides abscessus 6G-0728-S]EIU55682.1 hypothetical protein MA6G1108_4024 [Mycobacteroides abscessus 6G-1108]EIV20396.1 hypothetical protein MA3A0119R_4202 [Mycobacteroides abscessus 3A-0119-R]EIV34928.1 hypothetical protein MA3A0731_4291 [Mycobacteroides abscessus 3A-0731]EIV4612
MSELRGSGLIVVSRVMALDRLRVLADLLSPNHIVIRVSVMRSDEILR